MWVRMESGPSSKIVINMGNRGRAKVSRLTVVPEVTKTAQKSYVIDGIVGLLLQLDFPATLRRRPPSGTLVLANLVEHTRGNNLGRNALHPVGFVQISVAFVEILVIDLEGGVLLGRSLGDNVGFEVEERSGVRLARQGSLTDEHVRNVLKDSLNLGDLEMSHVIHCRLGLVGFLPSTSILRLLLAGESDPSTKMVHKIEDSLILGDSSQWRSERRGEVRNNAPGHSKGDYFRKAVGKG